MPIASVNFGTGESIFYPLFREAVEFIVTFGIPISLTTNGASVEKMEDGLLKLFHDIDFSIDFPFPGMNDNWRGAGNFSSVLNGIKRCQEANVECSIVVCLMKENSGYMGQISDLAQKLRVNLRINTYKPVVAKEHHPSYEEFWKAIKTLTSSAYLISCSEPIINALINHNHSGNGHPCGKNSFRLKPDGKVVPCVYIRHNEIELDELISEYEEKSEITLTLLSLPLPPQCQACELVQICQGGCSARRILSQPHCPDEYCFIGKAEKPQINVHWKKSKDLIHENYLCTLIFSP
jgi:radical SAM protein with 4Fe4S-binding SPASM domain